MTSYRRALIHAFLDRLLGCSLPSKVLVEGYLQIDRDARMGKTGGRHGNP